MRAVEFLVRTLFQLLVIAFLLRFILQWVRADFRNPICQAILRITGPLVMPLRRIIPSWGGADLASLMAAFLIELVGLLALHVVNAYPAPPLGGLLVMGLRGLLVALLQLYFFSILIYALLSWFNPSPYHPLAHLLHSISEPVLQPIRRIMPPIGGLDLSALVALIAIQALLLLVSEWM